VELEPLILLPPGEILHLHMPPIIDCTEFEMERPSSLDNQSAFYSQYKSRTTMKALIGITPSGATAFASELYPGSISDKEIVKRSGLLQILQPDTPATRAIKKAHVNRAIRHIGRVVYFGKLGSN